MPDKKILVVVDAASNENPPVIERAAWLAQNTGAALELFACDYDANVDAGHVSKVWIDDVSAREERLQQVRRKLEAWAVPLRARRLTVTVDAVWDYPLAEAIVKRAAAERPWLVAKDTEHYTLIQRTLLTNTDWQLIRECPVPLLLTKQHSIAPTPVVIAAVDPLHVHDKPAALDEAIYGFAAELTRSIGGQLHLVHASAPTMGVQIPAAVQALVDAEHRKAINAFVETHQVAAENVHLLKGLPQDCLKHAVEQHGADFVIMGAIARRGIKKVLIGSTAARVLDRLPCDIVIVKSAEPG